MLAIDAAKVASMRSIRRVAAVSINTVYKLLVEAGDGL